MNKEKEIQLQKAHESFFNLILTDFPLEKAEDFVANDIMGYGTTIDEKIFELEGIKEFVSRQREQGKNIKIDFETNPVFQRILNNKCSAIFVDELEIRMHLEEGLHVIPLRISTLLEFKDDTWKVVHWHASTAVDSENDTWHKDEWKQAQAKLEKQVQEKTAELLTKNRELEIEAAVERVRARTMVMQKSDELADVAMVLFEQVKQLGIKTWSTGVNIWHEGNDSYIDWVVSTLEGRFMEPYKVDLTVHPFFQEISQARKRGDDFFMISAEGETLKEHYRLLFEMAKIQFEDLEKSGFQMPEHQINHYVFGQKVSLMFITFEPCPEAHDIFKRLGKAFDQTYTRFLDLQKAEAQAREAQIEAALEQIRNRTLLMKNSGELNEAVAVFLKEFKTLELLPPEARTYFCDIDENKNTAKVWMTTSTGEVMNGSHVTPLTNSDSLKKYYKAWKNKVPILERVYTGKKLKDYLKFVSSLPHVQKDEDYLKLFKSPPKKLIMTDANFLQGNIGIMTFEKLAEEAISILSRFSKVFEFTYTRFLDLQKAEARTREAQIEAALERVRARSMAMHKSEELAESAKMLFQQLEILDVPIFSAGFVIWNDDKKQSASFWMSSEGMLQPPFSVSLDTDSIFKKYKSECLKGTKFYADKYNGKKLAKHYENIVALPEIQLMIQNMNNLELTMWNFPKSQVNNVAYFKQGFLLFSTYEHIPEAHDILKRFTRVFEQTYTRFLDLQKAESQAREAQIEAALEKVRSRSLAMHTGNELGDVVTLIVEKLKDLDVVLDANGVVLCTYFNDSKDVVHWISSPDFTFAGSYFLPYFDHPIFNDAWQSKVSGDEYFSKAFSIEEKNSFFEYAFEHSDYKNFPDDFKEWVFQNDQHILSFAWQKKSAILIPSHTGVVPSVDDVEILKRFARVFEQAYIRFLDLKKAEERAQETQIELSLERMRSQVTAMKESEELLSIMVKMRSEFVSLGHEAHYFWHMKWTPDKYLKAMTSGDGTEIGTVMELPRKIHGEIKNLADWEKSDEPAVVHTMDVEATLDYVHKMEAWGDFKRIDPNMPDEDVLRQIGGLTYVMARTKHGEIGYSLPGEVHNPPPKALATLIRFAKTFDLAYKRFEDLQSSERQSKEAQIELALERIRARALAMHQSSELSEAGNMVFQQMKQLGIYAETSWLWFIDSNTDNLEIWTTHENKFAEPVKVKSSDFWTLKKELEAWKNNTPFLKLEIPKAEAVESLKNIFNIKLNINNDASHLHLLQLRHKFGFLGLGTWNETTEEEIQICKRFANVFEQTYTRFLDLQKAEAQAREAQIEAALERVRARSMAMHRSKELQKVISVVFNEMEQLGVSMEASFINIPKKDSKDFHLWIAARDQKYAQQVFVPFFNHEICNAFFNSTERKEDLFTGLFSKESKNSYFEYLYEHSDLKFAPPERKKYILDSEAYSVSACSNNKHAQLIIQKYKKEPFTNEENEILKRFAKVFEQSYTRFLDIQKAEEQAREAKIEASLERVRSQAMAMQHSDDLIKCTSIVFEELEKLELSVDRSGIGIFDPQTRDCELWTMTITNDGTKKLATGITSLTVHPLLVGTFAAWKKQKPLSYVLEGQDLKDYYNLISKGKFHLSEEVVESSTNLPKEYYHYTPFGAGGVYVFSDTEPSDKEKQILHRFAEVFHLTYTRYEDLQNAEVRAQEAIKQASLDRVRGEIASMRTKDDLNRITPLIWKELIALDVPFIRCGVFIMDELNRNINTFLSTPNGDSIAAFHLPYDTPGNFADIVSYWKQKKNYIHHWGITEFTNLADVLIENGSIATREQYMSSMPKEGIHLNFVPFKQGMLYVGNVSPLDEHILELVKSLAETFSIAYARYEDFKLLEEAKNKVEDTLSELKSAQTQLVHSEKMASLGELTAGIAHEIQNPLNFVNNFSEISSELMEEMEEELQAGDIEEVKAITSDIIQNLDKINHHGKRASSIVRGMLQHSRTSSGQKEFTDINVLADECLRLSYHGLRAKDKSFNADFKLEVDENLPQINIISQDIGRVLLNLINNAFYAVSKKAKENIEGYKPLVSLTTSKSLPTGKGRGEVIITIIDNGPGISTSIKDKIFQPFFTTKPTGSGTGLGLSLSYDIVKAHYGEIGVESKENSRTKFTITLPLNNEI